VFAEEIEGFLERLDAVAAVRVVANEDGEIERIYATTESGRDDHAIRRAITSALMSQYNLHVDGWRVQVARLEPEAQPERIPECQLVRLEETISEGMTRVVVDLRYEREGTPKTISGSTQAPPGQAQRLRAVALATVDALRPLLERTGSRPELEGLSVLPFAGATVVMAAVSLASARGALLRVGCETVAGSEAEAAVGAVLDAVRKPVRTLIAPTGRRDDRQQRYESLRRQYQRMIQTSPPPTTAARPGEPEGEDTAPPSAPAPEAGASEDVIHSMAEIRPEREGGATLMIREEARPEGPPAKPAPRPAMEDTFYRRLATTGVPVHIRCRDGYEIPTAIVRDFGTYCLLVEVNGVQELLFKHGIIAIRPSAPLPPEPATPS